MAMTNCHTHVFTIDHVPRHFFAPYLPRLLRTRFFRGPLLALLDLIVPFTRADKLSRLASFVSMGVNHMSQRGVFDHLAGYYPPDTRFVLLSMDMKYMGAGDPPREFEQQLDELAEIKKDFADRVIPFIAVDRKKGQRKQKKVEKISKKKVQSEALVSSKV